jgi:Ca2+-binding EF-hand superfamily protein
MRHSVAENNDRYEKELQRQLANDALCRLFASQADPFSKWISDVKEKVTASKEDLQGQLKYVEEKLSSLESDGAPLTNINQTSEKMDAAGILTNKHTTLTAKDVQVQWQQYKLFLERKKVMLEEEVEREKLKGVTAEQFKEIEANFRQFDTANSGFLDRKAFKACLYSLGEEKTNAEIDGLMKEFGDGTKVPYEGYKNFMVQILGVSDTKSDIIGGFELMCRHNSVAKKERLDLVGMAEKDVSYFTATAPKLEDGWDFKAWTDDIFAR